MLRILIVKKEGLLFIFYLEIKKEREKERKRGTEKMKVTST